MKWDHLISNGQCTVIFKDPPHPQFLYRLEYYSLEHLLGS